MVMKIKNAIPVKNIHFTNRGKLDFLFIRKIYSVIKNSHPVPGGCIGKCKYLTTVFAQ